MKVIHLLRKPCSEGTVAANVLRHGTGALNIDGTRVEGAPPSVPQPDFRNVAGRATMPDAKSRNGEMSHATGRWPANLVLQHLDGCEQTGTREVKALGATGSKSGGASGPACIEVGAAPLERRAWVSDNGTETVAAWSCAEGCPVAALDEQSGQLPVSRGGGNGYACSIFGTDTQKTRSKGVVGFGDTGGASRFFKQFGG